jgi:hypothetical protein
VGEPTVADLHDAVAPELADGEAALSDGPVEGVDVIIGGRRDRDGAPRRR